MQSTVAAISRGDFKTASSLLPKKIENVFDEPRLFEVVQAIGEEPVRAQIEFELIKLAALMSVGGNLNKAQVSFISSQLIERYPNESIADFKLCFERGAIGMYGDIQRMDGVTIGIWMKKYLNEKYEVLEDKLMNERDKPYEMPTSIPSNPNLTEQEIKDWLAKWKANVDSTDSKRNFVLSETETLKRVKQIERPSDYPITSASELLKREKHFQWIKANFDARTGEKLATWTEENEWNDKNI